MCRQRCGVQSDELGKVLGLSGLKKKRLGGLLPLLEFITWSLLREDGMVSETKHIVHVYSRLSVGGKARISGSPRCHKKKKKTLFFFSVDDAKVLVIGKAKDLESRNSQIHSQLRCVFSVPQ